MPEYQKIFTATITVENLELLSEVSGISIKTLKNNPAELKEAVEKEAGWISDYGLSIKLNETN